MPGTMHSLAGRITSGGRQMTIFDYALQMKKDGEKYYRQLADESRIEGLQKIFTMLAEEEEKHSRVVEAIQQKMRGTALEESHILDDTISVFQAMRNEKQQLSFDTEEEARKYRNACHIESLGYEFYKQRANESEYDFQRQIFLKLADEEANHLRIMKNIVEFISWSEPGQWLKNIEWLQCQAN